jgi:WD40 repeat protein
MNRRWILKSFAGLGCLAAAACEGQRTAPSGPVAAPAQAVRELPPVEIGGALYKKDAPEELAAATSPSADIVISNAVVRLDKKQLISALVDGNIEVVGTPLPPNTPFSKDDRNLVFEGADTNMQLPYRRLREGDRVPGKSIVCVLDDLEARVQQEASVNISKACDEAIKQATNAADKIQETVRAMQKLGAAASNLELAQNEATLARYRENVAQSLKEKVKSDGDAKRADAIRYRHRARSQDGGIITKLMREPGEYVKAGDPIMEVLSTDDVRVEGILEAQNADAVRPGMKVVIEPSTPAGPDMKVGRVEHRREVTGVVVSAHKDRPQIVSASLDNTLLIQDIFPPAGKPRVAYRVQLAPEAQGVRSIAVTGEKVTRHLLAAGGEDGKIRLWDLSNPDKLSEKPMREFEESHGTGVASLAFSPDGRFLASAAGREVFLWNVGDGKKMYALQGELKDAVTTVRFTPQSTLVTASRDKALRVWRLGDKGANVERTIDHRKGNVDCLGISSKGGRALFDQEDGRIDVITLANGLPVGSVQNNGPAARFANLALFSPDDSLVLTAGGDGDMKGELQLWTAPAAGGRGSERKRLVVPGRATPTCAAFGPEGAGWFVVAGTQTGSVHVWTSPILSQQAKERTGQVTAVIPNDARTVRVTVVTDRVADTGTVLQDKSSATIIVKPGAVAAPAPVPGTATAKVGSGIVPAGGALPPSTIVPASATLPVVVPASATLPAVVVPALPMPTEKK